MRRDGRSVERKASSSAAGRLGSPSSRIFLFYFLLAVATFATYYPVSGHPFIDFDDGKYVTENSHLQAGVTWATIKWAFTTYYVSNWHPLTWISHAVDIQMFGLDPAGHHEVNLLFHVVNVLVLFWVLRKATGMLERSAMVAALFALHPINVETVAWVAERKNLLSMLFLLLALGAYRWYATQPRAGRYVAVAVLFALGLMAKPQVITLPFLLLLWDYWPLQRLLPPAQAAGNQTIEFFPSRSVVQLVVEKLPLFALSAISAVITVKAQEAGRSVQSLAKFPFSLRLENAIVSYARYLGKAFWPSPLSIFYPLPHSSPAWQWLTALLLLTAITGLVIAARKYRYLAVGWLWFLGTLVPMIGLVQVGSQSMADRYAYLSFVGLFLMVTWGIADTAEERHFSWAWMTGISALLLMTLAVVTQQQLSYWGDEVRLWSHAIDTTAHNYVAEDNLGMALLTRQQTDEALVHFRRAAAIAPSDSVSQLNIGFYEQNSHHWPDAIAAYQRGIRETDDPEIEARAYSNMGYVYHYMGDDANARESFEQATRLAPDAEQAWIGLGVLAQRSGDLTSAIRQYSHANQIRPSSLGYLLLARALHHSGRNEEAEVALQAARHAPGSFRDTQSKADGLIGR